MFEPKPAIYTDFLSSLTLKPEDRQALKTNRGFTDATIDALHFKSTSQEYQKLIPDLIQKYSYYDLIVSGLIDEKENLVWNFTKEGMIIIPYLYPNDTCYLFKSHKFGNIKGAPPIPYCNKISMRLEDPRIVLCESEFKAAAMWQMGYNALGLGGIPTFSGGHLDTLLNQLIDYKHIIIIFDTEIQDDPQLKSYKDSFRKRYAHIIWSYVMAKKLEKAFGETKKVVIGSLPEEWVIDGKIDIDTALSKGYERNEFEKIIATALPPDGYRRKVKVTDAHRGWINKRMESLTKGVSVGAKDNCYITYGIKKKGGEFKTEPKEISNFIIMPLGNYTHNDEVRRLVQLKNRYDEVSDCFFISHDEIGCSQKFKAACLNRGDFLWKGRTEDLDMVIEQMILDSDAVGMRLVDFVGRDAENKQWVFANMIIKDDGRIIHADDMKKTVKNREFKEDTQGWRINPIVSGSTAYPIININEININDIFRRFNAAWGRNGVLAIGYCIATLFSDLIFEKYQMFPFCLLYGEKESGKTTLSDAMMFLFGFPSNQTAMSLSGTTEVALSRKLNYYRSLPSRFDEYREGEKKIDDKGSLMRSIYNRQTASKGLRSPFGVREVDPKGSFILIGEQKPSDPALDSRCIHIYLTRHSRDAETYEAMRWIYNNHEKLSYFTYYIIKKYKELSKKILVDIEATRKGLQSHSSDHRTQIHYAIIIACLGAVFGPDTIKHKLIDIFQAFLADSEAVQSDSALNKFWSEVNTMRVLGEEVLKFFAIDYDNPNTGNIFFPGVYQQWKKFSQQRGGNKNFDERTLKDYLKSQPYCIGKEKKKIFTGMDSSITVYEIDLKHKTTPVYLKDIFKGIKSYASVTNEQVDS